MEGAGQSLAVISLGFLTPCPIFGLLWMIGRDRMPYSSPPHGWVRHDPLASTKVSSLCQQ